MVEPRRRGNILLMTASVVERFTGSSFEACVRPNVSNCAVISAARDVDSSRSSSTERVSSSSAGTCSPSTSAALTMTVSRLFRSWAIPLARFPTSPIFLTPDTATQRLVTLVRGALGQLVSPTKDSSELCNRTEVSVTVTVTAAHALMGVRARLLGEKSPKLEVGHDGTPGRASQKP